MPEVISSHTNTEGERATIERVESGPFEGRMLLVILTSGTAPHRTWQQRAACADMDPDLWFPQQGRRGGRSAAERAAQRQALETCAGCPVRAECAEVGRDELYGIWGGLTPADRARLRRGTRRQRPGPPRHPIPHGTARGYRLHLLRREPTCEACRAAEAEYRRELRTA